MENRVRGSRISKEWKVRPGLAGERTDARNRRTPIHLVEKGFFLVDIISVGGGKAQIPTVQSKSTNELFVNKVFRWTPGLEWMFDEPNELRVSNYPDIPDHDDDSQEATSSRAIRARRRATNCRELGGSVLPEVPYFNKLYFWQETRPDGGSEDTVYSLFFE